MTEAFTLAQRAGRSTEPSRLGESVLVMVDCQNTYTTGAMTLSGIEAAMAEAARVLEKARATGTPIIHVMHDSGPGSAYDIRAEIGQIHTSVAPREDEATVVKRLPNAFAGTDLQARLEAIGRKNLILAGFMTHMCINSTARGGFSLGYRSTVVGDATATRDLPTRDGGVIPAAQLHEASLAALGDLFAVVVNRADDLPA